MAIWLRIFSFPLRELHCEKQRPAATGGGAFNRRAANSRCWWMLCLLGVALVLRSQHGLAQSGDFNQCLNSCFGVCDSGPENLAWGCRENCGNSCKGRGQGQSARSPYGSIAIGVHGFEGISWNKRTEAAADQSAVATCNRYGSNCKVVYRYQNTCAAIAFSKGSQHYESATGNSEKQAEANATALCKQHWGYCVSNMSACSFR
jgi:hypothetical protein